MNYDQSTYLQSDILYKCDRASMHHSVENREVFLDSSIYAYSLRYFNGVNLNSKLQGNKSYPLNNSQVYIS